MGECENRISGVSDSRDKLRVLFPPSLGAIKAYARAESLEYQLSRELGRTVQVKVAESYDALGEQTLAAQVHLTWAPPTLCARAKAQARHLLLAVRGEGATSYRAALVCREEAPLVMHTLPGKRAAWVHRESTAGYILPRAYFRGLGIEPSEVLGSQAWYGTYRDAVMAVLHRDADLCSVYCGKLTKEAARVTLADLVGSLADQLVPFAFTGESPSDGLVFTEAMHPRDADELVALFTSRYCPQCLLDVCNAQGFVLSDEHSYRTALEPSTPPPAEKHPAHSE